MRRRVPVAELKVGMFIDELCASWMEHPFWRSRFPIKNDDVLRRIVDSGIREAWIDTELGADVDPPIPATSVEEAEAEVDLQLGSVSRDAPVRRKARTSLTEELSEARAILHRAKPALVSMFTEARMGRAIDTGAVDALVDEISASVSRNASALISLSRLRHADDYTYMHSAAVCAMMIALARQTGADERSVREAGLAGMMHDLGKARVPLEILNKPGALTDAEFAQMKAHPRFGHDMLVALGGIEPPVLDACLHHHEKIDGTGYPDGLAGDGISLIARMAAVCDVYDAITSNRPYKAGWSPAESIRRMAEWQKGHFDPNVFRAFVKTVGIYPIGSIVRLACTRLAVVVDIGARPLLRPLVKAFYSTHHKIQIEPEAIDLAAPGCTNKIVGIEDAKDWGLAHTDDLWAGLER